MSGGSSREGTEQDSVYKSKYEGMTGTCAAENCQCQQQMVIKSKDELDSLVEKITQAVGLIIGLKDGVEIKIDVAPDRYPKEINLGINVDEMNKYPEKPKTVISRSEVYKMIDTERDYQDWKQRNWDDSKWSVNDWVVFIESYLAKIKKWTGHPREQMDEMRKVAALAVVCMEFNGVRPRVNGNTVNYKKL